MSSTGSSRRLNSASEHFSIGVVADVFDASSSLCLSNHDVYWSRCVGWSFDGDVQNCQVR